MNQIDVFYLLKTKLKAKYPKNQQEPMTSSSSSSQLVLWASPEVKPSNCWCVPDYRMTAKDLQLSIQKWKFDLWLVVFPTAFGPLESGSFVIKLLQLLYCLPDLDVNTLKLELKACGQSTPSLFLHIFIVVVPNKTGLFQCPNINGPDCIYRIIFRQEMNLEQHNFEVTLAVLRKINMSK